MFAQGVPGDNLTLMQARLADVYAFKPDDVIVLGGVNDLGSDRTAVQMEATLTAIYADIVSHGYVPKPITILPFGNGATWTAPREAVRVAVNAWIKTQGYVYADVESAVGDLTNPARPVLKAAYDSGDGVHPNATGQQALADAVWAQAYGARTYA